MPTERTLRIAIVAVAIAGMAATGYLSIVQVVGDAPVCLTGGGGCRTVASSPYAELAGVRVSYLGMLGFVGLITAAMLPGVLARFVGASLALIGAGFSIYLTILEFSVIDAVCEYCLVTAATMIGLLVLTAIRVVAYGSPDRAASWEHADAQVQKALRGQFLRRAGASVLAAIAVLTLLIVVSQSGAPDGSGPSHLSHDAKGRLVVRGKGEIRAELSGLQQQGATIGVPSAPVTVTEYGDLQCPLCGQFAANVVPGLLEGPVATGDAKLTLRNWAIFGPESTKAAKAALAAGEQDRMWDFVGLFYRNQGTENTGYVTDRFLNAIARAANIDLERWNRDRKDAGWDSVLADIDAEARAHGFKGTPGLVIEGPGGTERIVGVPSVGELERAITSAATP